VRSVAVTLSLRRQCGKYW